MNSLWTRSMALVAVLVVTGCSTASDVNASPRATPDDPSPATQPATAQPSVPTVTPSRATQSRAAPSPTSTPVSESDFCHTVIGQTRPAITALEKLAKHPDGHGMTVRELSVPRDQLRASEAKAPQHLRKYLHSEVAILDAAVRQVQTGTKKHVPVGKFVDAKTEFILDCEMAE